jgi:Ser/Thr protein kinase RdoA (MazF antagonist)
VSAGLPPVAASTPPDGREVAATFDLGRPKGPPWLAARGELGRIWRLESATGTWAVKELFQPAEEARARADVDFQEAAIAAGVPMPRPILTRDGHVLADVHGAGRPMQTRVYTWVDLADRDAAVPAESAAAILGRLHDLAIADDRPIDPWFTDAVEPARWRALLEAAVRARASWADAFLVLAAGFSAAEPIIAAGHHAPTIRCHLDFNPENVLLDTSGSAVVVDWENSGPAAAEQELASAVTEFVEDPASTLPFLRAYAAAGGPATLHGRASFAMTLAVLGNLVASYAERALDGGQDAEDRARAAHWIDDIAAHDVSVDRIDRLLDAALG